MTIEVFSDLQCDGCDDYHLETIDPLIEDEVRAGEVKLIFRHYSQDADRATGRRRARRRVAPACRTSSGSSSSSSSETRTRSPSTGVINQDFLDQIANGILNLNVEQWQRDFNEEEIQDELEEDEMAAVGEAPPARPGRRGHRQRPQRGADRVADPGADPAGDRSRCSDAGGSRWSRSALVTLGLGVFLIGQDEEMRDTGGPGIVAFELAFDREQRRGDQGGLGQRGPGRRAGLAGRRLRLPVRLRGLPRPRRGGDPRGRVAPRVGADGERRARWRSPPRSRPPPSTRSRTPGSSSRSRPGPATSRP